MSRLLALPFPLRGTGLPRLKDQRVGIDIQETTMRVVCVGRQGGRWNWLSRSEVPFVQQQRSGGRGGRPERIPEEPKEMPPGKLPSLIATHLPPTIDAQSRGTSVVLPMSVSLVRSIAGSADEGFEKELRVDLQGVIGRDDFLQSMTWESGCDALAVANPNPSSRKIVYATGGKLCVAVADAVKSCGYQLPQIHPRPYVLARAVDQTEFASAYGVLEWGAKHCTLVLRKRWRSAENTFGPPGYTRQMHGFSLSPFLGSPSSGGTAETGEVREGAGESMIRERRRRGLANCIRSLASEIVRTLQTIRFEVPAEISPLLVVCGDAASLPGVCTQLKAAMGHAVVPWRWHQGIRPGGHFGAPDDSRFAAAIGTACYGVTQ